MLDNKGDNKGLVWLAGSIFSLIATCAALAPSISPFDPFEINFASMLQPPSFYHPFGTDQFGRDVLSRTLFGIRITVAISIGAMAVMVLLGCAVRRMQPYLFAAIGSLLILGTEAVIDWLGLVGEPTPTMGSIMRRGWPDAPWMIYFPSQVLLATAVSASVIGNTLRTLLFR